MDMPTLSTQGDAPDTRPEDGDGAADLEDALRSVRLSETPSSRSGGPSRWQVVALALALCFLSGVVGWTIARPTRESFNEIDVGFLSDMTAHHNSAIKMSFDYLRHENDTIVGHFAREIILTQSQEVALMNSLLNETGNLKNAGDDVAMDWMGLATPVDQMPGMPTQAESEQLNTSTGGAADDVFTRLMIQHHAAGAAMADYAAEHGENARVQRLAAAMARAQRIEINEMNTRRRVLGFLPIDTSDAEQLHGQQTH